MHYVALNNEKKPLTPLEQRFYKNDYHNLNSAGVILGNNVIVLDFDNDNDNEEEIIKYISNKYKTLCIKTNRGYHFYFKMPNNYKFKRSIKCVSNIGFMCDYLTGINSFAVIKLNGIERKRNNNIDFNNLDILPEEFYPLYKVKNKKLSGMIEGDARNNSLFSHLLSIKETYPQINISKIANIINNNIFKEKLSHNEINNLIKSVLKKEVEEIPNKDKVNNLVYSSAKDLQEKDLPPVQFYVENLIPQGLNIICSVPKMGKSFMALDLCVSIAKGTPFLGHKTKKAGCLYLALEDSENRLKQRLNTILGDEKAPDNFIYATRCDDIDNGLINQLDVTIKKEPYIKVIIIDTLQKIRGVYKGSNNYGHDYKEMSVLKEFADRNGLCIILIHHTKKGNENDVFNKISGTNGIMGSADTSIVIDKNERNDINATMHITGRDVEFNEYIIHFDKESCKWNKICSVDENKEFREKEEYMNNPLVETIKDLVTSNNNKWSGTLLDIEHRQAEIFSGLVDTKVRKNDLARITPLLKKYDNIQYYATAYPVKGKRLKTFIKNSVESVDNVESVDFNNTDTTNSTKTTY